MATKTPVYIDRELLRAIKLLAASTGRHDYDIVEDALRQYLDAVMAAAGREELRGLLSQIGDQTDRTGDETLELVYAELHAARQARRRV